MSDQIQGHASGTHSSALRGERTLQVLEQIGTALQQLRFGQVTITVQDGVVVQIERLERTRLQRQQKPPGAD